MAASKPGGFKMSLGALKAKPGLKSSPAQKDSKKSKPLLGDDEPEDSVGQQEITGWDMAEGGAVEANGKKEKEQLRVIPVPPNRDWRAAARRKHLAKAPHQQAQNETIDEKQMEEPKYQYGLTIMKKDEAQEDSAAEPAKDEGLCWIVGGTPADFKTRDAMHKVRKSAMVSYLNTGNSKENTKPSEGYTGPEAPEPMEIEQDNLTEQERLEKKALDALITGKSTDNDLVIPVQTEEEAFRNDLENAPEAPTLEAYKATPIEGFGAALLRGMGWKDGEGIGKNGIAVKPKEIKRRPALLGIGAKEDAAVGVELGEWGGGKGKGKKVAQSYNPVTLRNKRTGEIITEDELKAKLENQKLVEEEQASKAKSQHNDDSEDEHRREKRRERRDDRDRDRRREDDYDSERRRDKDRRREKDDYYDSDRRRDKRRERTRDDDYDSERRREKRRERDRSRSPDDRKDKRRDRDRYRSRSRDSRGKSDRRDRSRDDDDRRKRRRERDYDDDERYERKKKYRDDDKYYK